MATIHNWRIVSSGSPFMAPECRAQSIQGEVSGHPRYPDGRPVTTSTIARRISRAQRNLWDNNYDRGNPLG